MFIWVEEDTYTCAKKKTHTVAILYTEFLMVNPCTGEALLDQCTRGWRRTLLDQCTRGWRTLTLMHTHTHAHAHTHTVAIIPEFLMVNPCTGEALHDTHMGVHMGGGGHMFGLQMSYFEATVPPHPLTHPRSLDNHTRQNSWHMSLESRVCQVHRHRPLTHTHTHTCLCVCVSVVFVCGCVDTYIYIHACLPCAYITQRGPPQKSK